MIKISGSVHRSFTFPADLETAFNYYCDMNRTLNFLPHITILQRYADGQYRMLFSTTELGIYRVRVVCDMQAIEDRKNWVLRIVPFDQVRSIQSEAGMYSLTGQGYYTSKSTFKSISDQTEIEYALDLDAQLPLPLGLRFMPGSVVNSIARNITRWRIHETAEGFIERSMRAFSG
jgi:hypothetical protein